MRTPIIIWEPNPSGHRLSYVRYLAQWLNEMGFAHVIGTTEAAVNSTQWEKQGLNNYPHFVTSNLDTIEVDLPPGFAFAKFIIPDCDNKLIELLRNYSKLRRHEFTLLVMRPRPIAGRFGRTKYYLKILSLGLIKFKYRNTHIFALSSIGMKLPKPMTFLGISELQDPCEWSPGLTRRQLGLDENHDQANIFLVAGELSSRKYLPEILTAWISGVAEQNLLVLAGTLSQNLDENLIQDARKIANIHFVEGYIGNTEFDSWIDEANYVFVLHKNAGSSGVAIKAAFGGTTILVGGDTSIRDIVSQMTNNFAICDPVSSESIKFLVENVMSTTSATEDGSISLISPSQWSEALTRGFNVQIRN